MEQLTARERLIVALDVPTLAEARRLVGLLGDSVAFYKIGLELLFAGGLELAAELGRQHKRVFLDVKLLDIGHTVERAVASIAELGVAFVTVHGSDLKTLRAASAGRRLTPLKLLAVTVMTNLTAEDVAEQGIAMAPAELATRRALMAKQAGIDGVVVSGQEAAGIRAAAGPDLLIVAPGIRLAGSTTDDQERVATPQHAIEAGADYIVVGRPITRADDPKAAAATFVSHIQAARPRPDASPR